jgi:citrate lyase beta subunit
MIEKSAKCDADYVFLDLEDAVAPPDKPQARKNVIEALQLTFVDSLKRPLLLYL